MPQLPGLRALDKEATKVFIQEISIALEENHKVSSEINLSRKENLIISQQLIETKEELSVLKERFLHIEKELLHLEREVGERAIVPAGVLNKSDLSSIKSVVAEVIHGHVKFASIQPITADTQRLINRLNIQKPEVTPSPTDRSRSEGDSTDSVIPWLIGSVVVVVIVIIALAMFAYSSASKFS
jgi:hypothetical protein